MRLKINSKKSVKKVRNKFACTEKSRTFAPAFGKEARRRAGRRMKNLAENLEKSKILLIFAGGFPFLRGHEVFEMFWMDKRSSV